MRGSLLFVMTVLFCKISFANDRILTCESMDKFDRASQIEFNVDTGNLKMKDMASSNWVDVYSETAACGLKVKDSKTCAKQIWHNFDDLNVKNKSAFYSVKCKVGNRDMIDQNGALEINRFGDGTGSFVCGQLSRHDLYLTNCKVK
jgi:hypothetical protein